jgi:Mg-chelatase subunit ChlD
MNQRNSQREDQRWAQEPIDKALRQPLLLPLFLLLFWALALAPASRVEGEAVSEPRGDAVSAEGAPPLLDVFDHPAYAFPDITPVDLAFLDRDRVLISDGEQIRSVEVGRAGHRAWGGDAAGVDWAPTRLEVDFERARVFVLNAARESISILDALGQDIATIEPDLDIPSEGFARVEDIALAPSGALTILERRQVVGQASELRVHRYDAEGRLIEVWTKPALRLKVGLNEMAPRGSAGRIAYSADGNLLVWLRDGTGSCRDWRDGWLRFSPQGEALGPWQPEIPGEILQEFSAPPPCESAFQIPSAWRVVRSPSNTLHLWLEDALVRYSSELALDGWTAMPGSPWRPAHPYAGQAPRMRRVLDAGLYAARPGGGFAVASDAHTQLSPEHDLREHARWKRLSTSSLRSHFLQVMDARGERQHSHGLGIQRAAAPSVEDALALDRIDVDGRGNVVLLSSLLGMTQVLPAGTNEVSRANPSLPVAMDVALTEDGGGVVRGLDLETSVLEYSGPSGEGLWRRGCECGASRGIVVSGETVLVSDRYGLSLQRYALEDGSALPSIRSTVAHGLWPAALAGVPRATGPNAGQAQESSLIALLDLRGRMVERWAVPERGRQAEEPSDVALDAWRIGPYGVPVELAVAPDGRTAVIVEEGEVQMYSPNGGLLRRWWPQAEGLSSAPVDLAFGPDDRLYVLDGTTNDGTQSRRRPRVLVYDLGSGPGATAMPSPSPAETETLPSPTPGPGACRVEGEIQASPLSVRAGDPVRILQRLRADCPPEAHAPVDVLLVFANGGRGAQTQWLPAMREAATMMVETLDWSKTELGVIAHSELVGTCVLKQLIDGDRDRALRTIDAVSGTCTLSNINRLVLDEMQDGGRSEAQPSVVILAAGNPNDPEGLEDDLYAGSYETAARLASRGIELHLLEIDGRENSVARHFASRPEFYRLAPDAEQLIALAQDLGRRLRSYALLDLVLESDLHPDLDFVQGSGDPPIGARGSRLVYGLDIAPASGITLTYELIPRVGGSYPPHALSVARYIDGDGARRRMVFEQPILDVDGPSPTPAMPSPTPTSTPSPTRAPSTLFLPLLLKESCDPKKRAVDLVFVIDVSSSMTEPTEAGRSKLAAASEAAGILLQALATGDDNQAALVVFDAGASVEMALSADFPSLRAALAAIASGSGSCVACGLEAAARVLGLSIEGSPTPEPEAPEASSRSRALVLLTDGRSSERPMRDALALAEAIRAQDTTIFSIGLGEDAELDALRAIAGNDETFFHAPDGEDLKQIYQGIERAIPCPIEHYWGRR